MHAQRPTTGDDAARALLPLTAAQSGMWFAEVLTPDYSVNVAQYLDIEHGLDFDHAALADSLVEVSKALQSPYIRLTQIDGEVRQQVDLGLGHTVGVIDLRCEADPVSVAMKLMHDDYRRPLDLFTDRLIETSLMRVSDTRTLWYMRGHHIVIDGYAALTLTRAAVDRYNAGRRGLSVDARPTADMAEIVADEARYVAGSRRESDREYWLERTAGLPDRATLSRNGATAPLNPDNVVASVTMDPVVQGRLDALCAELGVSSAVVLTTAFGAYLSRMSGRDDVVLSLPVTGRATAKIKNAGGMLANMLPICIRGVGALTVRELIDQARLELTGALRHQRYRFEDIRRESGLDADSASFGPVINMMFFDKPIDIEGATAEYHILSSGILEDNLLNLYQASPGAPLVIDLHGNPALYSAVEIAALHARFVEFLGRFIAAEALDVLVAAVSIHTADDTAALATRPEPAARAEGDPRTLVDLFAESVGRFADRVAVTGPTGQRLTYRELDERSSRAGTVLRWLGVARGDLVGIAVERDVELPVALLGVLKSGAGYLPLDSSNPVERLRGIVDDAAPACVIVDGERPSWIGDDIPVVSTESLLACDAELDEVNLTAAETAYVIYTSGSTGRPKGVEITHHNVVALLAEVYAEFDFDESDVWTLFHSYAFDFSVWELFGPLLSGGRVVLVDRDVARAPDRFLGLLAAEHVTVLSLTPSAFYLLTDVRAALRPHLSLRHIVFGGEALSFAQVARWFRLFADDPAQLTNMYGITETTVHVTIRHLDQGLVMSESGSMIGRPLSSLAVRVLDNRLQPTPDGAVGELYVAGEQLARSYLRRPDLTATRFIADPTLGARAGTRLYRTGDLGRRVGEDIEYLGRIDSQVQLRGFRIELGEVEEGLRNVAGVDRACAAIWPNGNEDKLVGYVVGDVDPDAVREKTRDHLPSYMVPDVVVALESLPLTVNGKLDRKALPSPPERLAHVPARDPESAVERRLLELVDEVLEIDGVTLGDNLFALGGNSLEAARLAHRIRGEFSVPVALADLFDAGNLLGLAERIAQVESERVLDPADIMFRPVPNGAPRPDRLPLSPAQKRIWFINRVDPGAATYNMAGAVELGPHHDPEAMRRAFGHVLDRHEPLRTRYPSTDGEPAQEILATAEVIDRVVAPIRRIASADVRAAITDLSQQGFDLEREVPVRCTVLEHPAGYVVVFVVHHVGGDGLSLPPLLRDLLHVYEAVRVGERPFLPPLPLQYADYAIQQLAFLGDPAELDSPARRELDFWTAELAGIDEVELLPADRPRPVVQSGAGAYLDREIGASLVRSLSKLAARNRATAFHVVHGALAVLLARLSGSEDVTIGTAVSGRDDPLLADVVGMFVNTVVLRSRIRPDATADEIVADSRAVSARALSNSHVSFEQVVEAVSPERSLSASPLFQVIVSWQDDLLGTLDSGFGARLLDARVPAAKFDLHISFTQKPGADGPVILAEFCYATDLFDRATIAALADQFERVLAAIVSGDRTRVSAIDLVPAARVRELAAVVPAAGPRTLRDLVAELEARPDRSVVAISGARTVTRNVFEARTNQIARELIARGVGPGSVVAIVIGRSSESVIATFAVIKTGAAFVSIDPRYPAERQATMLADSGSALGLLAAAVPDSPAAQDLPSDMEWLDLSAADVELQIAGHSGASIAVGELLRVPQVDDLAYMIYTSGSTGRPKAAAISHRGLANFTVNQLAKFGLTSDDRVLHVASPSFDASMLELLSAIGSGSGLVVAPASVYAGRELETLIAEHGATHTFLTPSVLATLDPTRVRSLRTVICGGEAVPQDLVRRWVGAAGHRRFFNGYGPTENTIFSVWAHLTDPEAPVVIGDPLGGVGAYVLDSCLRPVPDGVQGELYLAGPQLARGYHRRAGQTSATFVANPYISGSRMYRTGDRVTRSRSGELIYHGRTDFQLKIRGLRIEPGEVDAVLESHPDVITALSVGVDVAAGEVALVAYVSTRPGSALSPDDLLGHAGDRLPRHMVPHTVMFIDEFPLTHVGKIDRRALPPVTLSTSDEYVAPRTQLEMIIAGVFAEVTEHERVGVRADFFGLGGTSLSAVKVTARLGEVLGQSISVRQLFEAPTVGGLAEYLMRAADGDTSPPLRPRTRAELVPLSAAQHGMWLLNQTNPESAAYNVAFALRADGELDDDALRLAAVDLVARHEALRTTYPMIGGEPHQVIIPADVVAGSLDFRRVVVEGEVAEAIASVTGEGFNVAVQVPLRLAVLELSPTEHILVFVVHHICGDGASMVPLARDIMTAYAARRRGHAPQWSPLAVQYADFTIWQSERLESVRDEGISEAEHQLRYWAQRLDGAPDRLELPADRPRPPRPSHAGGKVDFEIGADTVRALEVVARNHNATTFMVAHAAFAVLLSRLSGQPDIVIGTPYAGRDLRLLDDLVGMFVNTLALRTDVNAGERFSEVLERVRSSDLADMSHTDVAFGDVVERVVGSPAVAYNPVFQAMLAFQNLEFPTLELDGLTVRPESEELTHAKFDLELTLFANDPEGENSGDGMRGRLVYAQDLFDHATAAAYAERFVVVLDAVTTQPDVVVGDIALHTEAELAAETGGPAHDEHPRPLTDLVADAAVADPAATAVAVDGHTVTFAELSAGMVAVAAVLPDGGPDGALTMVLMTSLPGLSDGGPESYDAALGQLRRNAEAICESAVQVPATDGNGGS
uniref:amino acid adenylation domain-containing protein n=1 Tax=Gordonia sp. B7-2 TaxID=3420932 RepID=UPI003D8A50FD